MSFFGAILLALFIYVLFRVAQFYIRFNRAVKNSQNKQRSRDKKEGEVTINTSQSKQKKVDNDVGEYVPFEEVDK